MTPHYADDWLTVYAGDCRAVLATLPAESVHCVVTSPPYWGLRDYGQEGQLGLEPTPEQYVENMVAVFREVRRVLRNDGTLWLNLGDSYAASAVGAEARTRAGFNERYGRAVGAGKQRETAELHGAIDRTGHGLKPKDLVGIPWRVAFALQADGWYLRSDIIWSKPNPMPESVTDRPTKSHEYLFLLSKSPRYYFDADAVREPHKWQDAAELAVNAQARQQKRNHEAGRIVGQDLAHPVNDGREQRGRYTLGVGERNLSQSEGGRNIRSVWTIPTQPYPGAHFAVFPPKLVEPCVLASTSEKGVCPECGAPRLRVVERGDLVKVGQGGAQGKAERDQSGFVGRDAGRPGTFVYARHDVGWQPSCAHDPLNGTIPATVLDPFAGSGTVGVVAQNLSRRAVLIDLNPSYIEQQLKRNRDVPLGLTA